MPKIIIYKLSSVVIGFDKITLHSLINLGCL